jgi:hypothetical protein
VPDSFRRGQLSDEVSRELWIRRGRVLGGELELLRGRWADGLRRGYDLETAPLFEAAARERAWRYAVYPLQSDGDEPCRVVAAGGFAFRHELIEQAFEPRPWGDGQELGHDSIVGRVAIRLASELERVAVEPLPGGGSALGVEVRWLGFQ